MIITCTHCKTKFKIADEKVKPGGIKVRCSKCKNVFEITPAADADEINLQFDLDDDSGLASKLEPMPREKPPDPMPHFTDPGFDPLIEPSETPNLAGPKTDIPDDLFEFPQKAPGPPPLPKTPPTPPVSAVADPMQALDHGLDDLLQQPTKAEEEGSRIPLTLPEEIDLKGLARKNPLSPEGIELVSQMSPATHGLELSTASEEISFPTDLMADPSPAENLDAAKMASQVRKSMRSSVPEISGTSGVNIARITKASPGSAKRLSPAPRSQGGRSVRILVSVFLLATLFAGILGAMVFKVHGRLALSHFNPETVRTFVRGVLNLGPGGSSSEDAPSPFANQLSIGETTTTFVRNLDNRNLLVISGKVTNISQQTLNFIRVMGRMYSAQNDRLSEKEVWAGNHFSKEELFYFAKQEDIDKEYSATGRSLANMNILANYSVPFQIVILDPPPEWDHFEVVISGAQIAPGHP